MDETSPCAIKAPVEEIAWISPRSIISQITRSILPTVIAPLIVRKRTAFLSLVMASSAFAPRATCAAKPPYGASFEIIETTEVGLPLIHSSNAA